MSSKYPKYYALYGSSVAGTTGCTKQFCSEPKDELRFPPNVTFECDVCNTTHFFRLVKTYFITSPSKQEKFIKDFLANIESGIIVTDKNADRP